MCRTWDKTLFLCGKCLHSLFIRYCKLCSKPRPEAHSIITNSFFFFLGKKTQLLFNTRDPSTFKPSDRSWLYRRVLCWLHPGRRLQSTECSKLQIQSSTSPSLKLKKKKYPPPFFLSSQYLHLKPWKENGTDNLSCTSHLSLCRRGNRALDAVWVIWLKAFQSTFFSSSFWREKKHSQLVETKKRNLTTNQL